MPLSGLPSGGLGGTGGSENVATAVALGATAAVAGCVASSEVLAQAGAIDESRSVAKRPRARELDRRVKRDVKADIERTPLVGFHDRIRPN
jgi:hypothetical protein